MSLVESLLGAILRLDGNSLVLHTGEKPYVVTSTKALNAYRGPLEWGQVELSTRLLSTEAVLSMLDQMLTSEQRRVLDDLGAVENELPPTAERPAFTVIAARGGDDIWVEIRPLRPVPAAEPVPQPAVPPAAVEPPREVVTAAASPVVRQTQEAALEEQLAVASEQPPPIVSQEPQPAPSEGPARVGVGPEDAQPSAVLPLQTGTFQEIEPEPVAADAASAVWLEEQEPLHLASDQMSDVRDGEAPAVAQASAAPEPVSETFGAADPVAIEAPPPFSHTQPPPSEQPHGASAQPRQVVAIDRGTPNRVDQSPPAPAPRSEVAVQVEAPAPVMAREAEAPVAADARTPQFVAAESEELASAWHAQGVEQRAQGPLTAPLPPEAPAALEIVPDVEQEEPDEAEVAQLLASSGLTAVRPSEAVAGAGEDVHREARAEPWGSDVEEVSLEVEPPAAPAVVVPLARAVRQAPEPQPPAPATAPAIERLLRVAAARGASGLYLVARSQPAVRVDGEMQRLESEEPLSGSDVEALMLALAPEPTRDAVRSGETSEWFRDVPDIGRVRCLSFHDHRGPGVIVRMLPARAISVEQLGLSKDIQALCGQPDGLVLVAGPRASGKSTLMAAFVDLINRTRADHVITIERQITFVHENRRSFLSQREVRGEAHEVLAAVRSALREDPDVLVVEELRSPEVIAAALDAAETGRLVLAGFRAPGAGAAIERLVDHIPAERRGHALAALSTGLRAVLAQVLLRKRGGGSIAARELLLNTPAAASVIAEGKLFQLSAALESGRKLGSIPLNDALASLIRDGVVDAGEAWRKAHDREGLLAVLKREGIDTSFVERLA